MKTTKLPARPTSRRTFLRTAAFTAATFQIVPSYVLGLRGATPPGEKLNVAGIGVSGQGGHDISQFTDENIVALCDVDWRHAAGTFKRFPGAKAYRDYRKMLEERKDIDAVVVATPDHVHAFASMAALQLGKHVYCEKPLTHSVWEARQIAQAAARAKVATQMGNQGQASEGTRRLAEHINAGAIGAVREAHIWTDRPGRGLREVYWPQGIDRPSDTPPVPDTLSWDLWIGPAPARPYHPAYAPFRWRGWWDFGTGALGDIGCHTFDPVFRALRLGAPTSVQATSSPVNDETYPLASMVTYQFPARGDMPGVKLVWYDGGLRPARPEGMEKGAKFPTTGRLLVGDRGYILNDEIYPASRRREFADVPRTLPRSAGHYREWVDACKGGAAAGSNFAWAGPLTEAVLLGNVALRPEMREEMTEKALLWDAANLRFTNSDMANRFLRREYRAGWQL